MTDPSQKYQSLIDWLADSPLSDWQPSIAEQINEQLRIERWGDMPGWNRCLERLPEIDPLTMDFKKDVSIGDPGLMDKGRRLQLQATLMDLHPWRKGPYNLFGLNIDTEWRSDWKWDRVLPHIEPLNNRLVLDIGCGNGYHCWRMLGAGAAEVIGIDPTPLFILQFKALQRYLDQDHIHVLPLTLEAMPEDLPAFDTVFSMGVLYHRRDPLAHLKSLKGKLVPGGQLLLETLVVEGDHNTVLEPNGRYARMGNVWHLPSPDLARRWMSEVGLIDATVVDVGPTSVAEQRSTQWMTFHSLSDFLDPQDPRLTVEGYPAPRRAVFTARAPG